MSAVKLRGIFMCSAFFLLKGIFIWRVIIIALYYAIDGIINIKGDAMEIDVCPSQSSTMKSIAPFTFDLQGVHYFLQDYSIHC